MRTILFIALLAMITTSCLNNAEQPYSTNNLPPQTNQPATPPNSAVQGKVFTISTDAFYQGNLKPASANEQVVSLYLKPTHWAKMTTEYMGQNLAKVDTGQWTTLENGNLMLNLHRMGEKESSSLEFKTDGDKLIHTGTDYGTDGLTLWVKPVPEGMVEK